MIRYLLRLRPASDSWTSPSWGSVHAATIITALFVVSCNGDDDDDDMIEPYPGPCITEKDFNGDGALDSRWVFTYDENGLQIQGDLYSDDDENIIDDIVDVHHYWHYNDAGLVTLYQADQGADGDIDDFCEYEFDANGWHSLRECYDDDEFTDGPEIDTRVIYDYSADGLLLFERSAYWSPPDDAWLDQDDTHYYYDSDALLVRKELVDDSDDDPDTVDWSWEYTYDEQGLLIRVDVDSDGDEIVDIYALYSNNESGYVIRSDTYTLPGDTNTFRQLWNRDDRQNPLVWSREDLLDDEIEYEYYYYDCWE